MGWPHPWWGNGPKKNEGVGGEVMREGELKRGEDGPCRSLAVTNPWFMLCNPQPVVGDAHTCQQRPPQFGSAPKSLLTHQAHVEELHVIHASHQGVWGTTVADGDAAICACKFIAPILHGCISDTIYGNVDFPSQEGTVSRCRLGEGCTPGGCHGKLDLG